MTVHVAVAVKLEDSTGDSITVVLREDPNYEERWNVGGVAYATDSDLRAFALAILTDLLHEPMLDEVHTLSGESIRPYGSDDPPL